LALKGQENGTSIVNGLFWLCGDVQDMDSKVVFDPESDGEVHFGQETWLRARSSEMWFTGMCHTSDVPTSYIRSMHRIAEFSMQ